MPLLRYSVYNGEDKNSDLTHWPLDRTKFVTFAICVWSNCWPQAYAIFSPLDLAAHVIALCYKQHIYLSMALQPLWALAALLVS
jgi:hypothetical protein